MNKTMMTYNGEGGELGMMTLEQARQRFAFAYIENGCITVGDEGDEVSEGPQDSDEASYGLHAVGPEDA